MRKAIVRLGAHFLIIALAGYYYNSWWGLLAVIPLITAYFSFCPLYKLLGINTFKKK
jgi:hypothetical protein